MGPYIQRTGPLDAMKITIIYDNQAKKGLKAGWGFSCLIENTQHILFDTGNNGQDLLSNFQQLHIDPHIIDRVVLSHDHWDHTGGLKALQKVNNHTRVIWPKDFANPKEISPGIFTTGALGKLPKEQSLVVTTQKGNVVVTGCAHPGLDRILQTAGELGRIYGVLGGFHGFSKFDELEGIQLIGPCHCTQYRQDIKERYPAIFMEIKAGSVIEI